MQTILNTLIFCFLLFALALPPLSAQSSLEQRKSEKYLKILAKKPRKGYLFDRFYESWLKYSSQNALQALLQNEFKQTKNPAYLQLLAYYYEKEGKDDDALNVYDQLLTLKPASTEILLNKAQLEYFEKNYTNAIRDLKMALSHKPDQPTTVKINKLLGKTYIRSRQTEKGLETWSQLLVKEPNNIELGEELIQLQLNEGLFKDAAKTCENLIARTKKEFKKLTLQLQLADILLSDNKQDKALEIYSALLEKVSSNSWLEKELLSNVEKSFKEQDNTKGLLKWYQQVLAKYPNRPELNKHYAIVLFDSGKPDDALKVFKKVLKLLPLDKKSREEYVKLLLKAGKPQQALTIINDLIKNNRFDAELYLSKAEVAHQLNKQDITYEALKQYTTCSGNAENSYIKVARLLQSYNMKDQALKVFNEMVKLFPENTDAAEMRIVFLFNNNYKILALEDAKKLASKVNLEGLIRLIKILQSFKEFQIAKESIESRSNEFNDNFDYNQELYSTYILLKQYKQARQPAEKQLKLAKTYFEINKACSNIAYSLDKTGQTVSKIKKLAATKKLTLNDSCLLADLYIEAGQIKKSLALIGKQLKQYPDSEILLTQKLKIYQKNYDYVNTIDTLQRLMKLHPHRKSYYTRELAVASQKAGKDDKALQWIKKWKILSPGATAPYVMEARIYESAGKLNKAIQTIQKAVRIFPDNKELKFNLANLYLANDDFKGGADIFWRFIKRSKNLAEKVSFLKKLLSIAKSREEKELIITKLKKYQETLPNHVFPLLALAEAYKAIGNQDLQHKYLKMAAKNRANDVPLLRELAKFAEEEGNYDQALRILKKAEKIDKTQQTSRIIAMFYLRHNEEEKGYRKLIGLLGGKDLSSEALQQSVLALYKANRYDIALNLLKKNISKFTDDYKINFLYAVVLEACNEIGPAIEYYLKVFDIINNLPSFNREYKKWRNDYLKYIYVLNYYDEAKEIKLIQHLLQSQQLLSPHLGFRQLRMAALGRGASKSKRPLPEQPDEASVYTMAHLARLFSRLNNNGKEKLISELRRKKVQYPEIKLQMQKVPFYSSTFWNELYKQHPDDDVITCLWGGSLLNGTRDQGKVEEGFRKTQDKKARLAVNIVINSIDKFRNVKINEQLIRDTIRLYDTLPERNPSVFIYRLCNFLMKQPNISSELKEFITQTSLELHHTQVKGKKAFKDYYLYVYYMLLLQEKYDLLIKDLLGFFSQDEGDAALYSKPSYSLFKYNILNNPHLISFPPENIPEFPAQILRFFKVLKNSYGNFATANLQQLDRQKLWKHAKKLQNNGLKLLLANLCGREQDIKGIIKQIKNRKEPALPLLILAGFYEYQNGNYESAVSLFEKALPLAMNRNLKKDLYTIIIQSCSSGVSTGQTQLKSIGIEAAKKLAKMRISQQTKQKLIAMLAKSFSDQASAEALAKTLPKRKIGRQPSVRNPRQQLDLLLSSKRYDEALNVALREFRKQATAHLALPANSAFLNSSIWQLQQLKKQLQQYKCINRFLNKLNPGKNASSIAKLLEYAFGLELLGHKQQAIKVYQNVLTKNPKNRSANFRLAIIMADQNLQQAETYLNNAIGNNIDSLGVFLTNASQNISFSTKLALTELFIRKFHALKAPIDIERATWLTSLIYQLEKPASLPSIFDQVKSNDPLVNDLIKRRINVYLALCDIAIKSSDKAAIAFPSKLLLLEILGKVDDSTYTQAKQIIKRGLQTRYSNPRTTVYVNQQKIPLQSPFQFIIQYATKHNKSGDLLQFINSLSGERKSAFKKLFNAILELQNCSKSDFIDNAQRLLQIEIPQNLDTAHEELDLKFSFIFMIQASRFRDLSLTPLVLKELKNVNKNNPYYLAKISFPSNWLDLLLKHSNNKEIVAYFNDIVHIVGSRYFSGKIRVTSQNHSQDMMIRRLLDSILDKRGQTVFEMAKLFTHPEYSVFNQVFIGRHINMIMNRLFFKNADKSSFIQASSWLGEFKSFQFVTFHISKDTMVNLLKLYVDYLQRPHNNYKKNLVLKLLNSRPKQFGTELLKIAITAKSQTELYAFIAKKLPEIQQAPKAQQINFLSLFIATYPPVSQSMKNNSSWLAITKHYNTLNK